MYSALKYRQQASVIPLTSSLLMFIELVSRRFSQDGIFLTGHQMLEYPSWIDISLLDNFFFMLCCFVWDAIVFL